VNERTNTVPLEGSDKLSCFPLSLLQEDGEIFLVVSEHLRDVAGAPVHSMVSLLVPLLLQRPQWQRAGLQPFSLRLSSLAPAV